MGKLSTLDFDKLRGAYDETPQEILSFGALKPGDGFLKPAAFVP